MKRLLALSMLLAAAAVHAENGGIFERFGENGPMADRYGGERQVNPRNSDDRSSAVYVTPDGKAHVQSGDGAINTQTGEFYPSVGDGLVVDPKTGQVMSIAR